MKFNFKSTRPNHPSKLNPSAEKAVRFLDALPDGDLIDSVELAAIVNITKDRLNDVTAQFLDYRHIVKGKGWFGNKRTIAALKKEFA